MDVLALGLLYGPKLRGFCHGGGGDLVRGVARVFILKCICSILMI